LIWLDGADLRALPLTERRRHLQNILPKGSAIISEMLSVTGRGHKLFELMCAHDLEGSRQAPEGSVWPVCPVAEDHEPWLLAERRQARIVRQINRARRV
jgi:hypothetical protein